MRTKWNLVIKMAQVTCQACGYTWNTNSPHEYVSCPKCGKKVLVHPQSAGPNVADLWKVT